MWRWRRRWPWARRPGKPVLQFEETIRLSYAIKEIFLTLQGEGAHAGRAAVFCRFSGCNLWSGGDQDPATGTCWFGVPDFVGTDGPLGGRYASAAELADTQAAQWTGTDAN